MILDIFIPEHLLDITIKYDYDFDEIETGYKGSGICIESVIVGNVDIDIWPSIQRNDHSLITEDMIVNMIEVRRENEYNINY